ncbi:uncharacterized protein LOC141599415 isoform X1 [Silene latifolia]|uniref:uncharacterized protein LOC141599415 isoform X1 n=1 Tax=Silene latifolia TaxID=37657 RepID=UPI003D7701E0
MAALTKNVGVFPKERAIVDKERAKGCYMLGPYLLSKLLAEIPIGAAFPLLFGSILYHMARLHPTLSRSDPKKAREMWFLTRFYTTSEAQIMGLINTVVPLENLEKETVKWCMEILRNSPTAIRVLKSALNAVNDGHAGLQVNGTRIDEPKGLNLCYTGNDTTSTII